ncbi:MAG: rhodanese-like domain-containing protein [Microbacterium sp.]
MALEQIAVDRLASLGDVLVVDVREPDEYADGHVPNAVNIPLGSLRERAEELRSSDRVYVVCQSGRRSAIACEVLESLGSRAVNATGGTSAWISAGLPVQR